MGQNSRALYSKKRRLGIIGAGLGGITAALYARMQGWDVEVYERQNVPGGKMHSAAVEGQIFDQGPTVLTWPSLIDALFASAGKRREDYLELLKVDPQYHHNFTDGTKIEITSEDTGNSLIAQGFTTKEEWGAYQSLAQRYWDETSKYFLSRPWRPFDLLRPRMAYAGWRLDAHRRYGAIIDTLFSNRYLRHIMKYKSIYLGSEAATAPAAFLTMPYLEEKMGIWQPVGGLGQVTRSLEKLGKEIGISFYYNMTLTKLNEVKGKWLSTFSHNNSITLESFDAVVYAGDVMALRSIFPASISSIPQSPRPSSSAIIWHIPTYTKNELPHHSVWYPENPEQELKTIVRTQSIGNSNHTVYVVHRGATEKGVQGLYVLIPLPPLSISFDSWSKNSSSNLWEYAYEVLKKRVKISDNIAPANEWTPIDFAHKQLSYRGTIFGLAADFWQSAFFRPYNRIKKGLYLVGAGTQPGGGVPLVQISASFAINLLNKDFPT